ncbi:hypothetical protein [Sinorhizobium terangae]|uniref:Uncharacterized protein n=1 Tax=Sinorhizobium terangae TaxID=110322 RepID=A0A6N7LGM9_SINTE|nr:hypothetical protein [Sinorhizobium terangae]MBB4184485.1 hypothetical protein [Sinorhizobium terangae]MQX16358.1 hypothetical protein [Sinorhizobium terangae]WFU50443.1 hypothetical protein QA637_27180 [Sinorhizobium terangae]
MKTTEKQRKDAKGAQRGAAGQRPAEKDSDLHPRSKTQPVEPDDLPNHRAMREAARQKRDDYLVESDLEDADQRYPTPGMKDQE